MDSCINSEISNAVWQPCEVLEFLQPRSYHLNDFKIPERNQTRKLNSSNQHTATPIISKVQKRAQKYLRNPLKSHSCRTGTKVDHVEWCKLGTQQTITLIPQVEKYCENSIQFFSFMKKLSAILRPSSWFYAHSNDSNSPLNPFSFFSRFTFQHFICNINPSSKVWPSVRCMGKQLVSRQTSNLPIVYRASKHLLVKKKDFSNLELINSRYDLEPTFPGKII